MLIVSKEEKECGSVRSDVSREQWRANRAGKEEVVGWLCSARVV